MKVWRLLVKNAMQTFTKRYSRKSRKRRRNARRKPAVSVFGVSTWCSKWWSNRAFVSSYEFNYRSLLPVSTKLPYELPSERVMPIIHCSKQPTWQPRSVFHPRAGAVRTLMKRSQLRANEKQIDTWQREAWRMQREEKAIAKSFSRKSNANYRPWNSHCLVLWIVIYCSILCDNEFACLISICSNYLAVS